MTSDSTATGGSGLRRRAGWALVVAAAVLPGFTAVAQPATAASTGYHIYAHGYLSNGIAGYNASDTAAPTPVPGRATPGAPNWPEAASPDGRFLYVAPTLNPRLISYAIGPEGGSTRARRWLCPVFRSTSPSRRTAATPT